MMRHDPELAIAVAALGDRHACLAILHERHALEEILKNPANRDVQKWAKARYLEITEEPRT